MCPRNACLFVVFLIVRTVVSTSKLEEDAELLRFLGTLESYEHTRNDVVFLLDESGSIQVERFPQVTLFTKMIARRLTVSADYSRIAVVTFSTGTTPHIDYIKDPTGNNMCTLLKQIDDIPYAGGWTHTYEAMKEAESILAQGEPDVKKIIVLLSDGQSNAGHSPVSISKELKSKGVIIFAVGVADANLEEIKDVASSEGHAYILKNFDYITEINKQLVNDITESALDLAPNPSYCDSSCDINAKCYCGARTGKYECICNAGYFGKGGRIGECHKCSRGTYKNESNTADCTVCPEHSTTKNEGSTSFNDCKCDSGYVKNGTLCSPVKCAPLYPPEGGILIPTHCDNTYGSHCSVKCLEGYCPFSCNSYYQIHPNGHHGLLQNRTCLETGTWSNAEFLCEKMTCPALFHPINGRHNCSEKDFKHGTTCQFTCDKGYELTGSLYRSCLLNRWTGQDVKCQAISCNKLRTNALLHVKPNKCGTHSMPYRSTCAYSCIDGYTLVLGGNKTDGIFHCGADKTWSVGYDKISCEDTERPKLICPAPITVVADPNKGLALVEWDKPNATDNVYVQNVRIIEPKSLKKPAVFPIGKTKVVYEATDTSKLKETCSFLVEVVDKSPPKLISCPADMEVYHDTNKPINVTWSGPEFQDNSNNVTITSNRKSGAEFAWGPPSVVYFNASDPSGNKASCSFTVKVKPYPCPYYNPPANGVMTCDNWNDGRLCSIFCHEGFEFATGENLHDVFYCKASRKNGQNNGTWIPFFSKGNFKMPWPDCSKKQLPVSLNVSVNVAYSVDSCSDAVLKNMQERFFNLTKNLPPVLCPRKKGCAPENVKVTCNPILTRRKRSTNTDISFMHTHSTGAHNYKFNRIIRETPKQMLTIHFDVVVFPNQTNDDDIESKNESGKDEINIPSNTIIKELEDKISLQVKDMYNVTSLPKPEISYGVIAMCAMGQISVNNSCVNCPAGTYKDDVSDTCMYCPQATYQDEERQLSCKACPVGYTTYEVKSKSRDDCKGPCQPGTYSKTSFEPCFACPLNTYQDRDTRNDCLKCPSGLYTWKTGANASSDCVAPCKPGSFSDTGYEPCTLCDIGSFQDKELGKDCEICPNQTSTTVKGGKNIDDCKEIDICNERSPCQYGSTCIQQDKDYQCICPEGIMGRNCEINFDDCASSPCLNNGTCIDDIGKFTCICLDGWMGHQCENNQDDCTPNPCFNSGECIDKVNTYECQCVPGFIGERCETNIYECESNPCLNNGTCFDKQNGYRCCCPKGYFGLNCEHEFNINICDSVTCQNGGTCFADKDGFNCSCVPGFEGEFCETNIDDCKLDEFHCQNGGICVDGIENATCICPKTFSGLNCEKAVIPEFLLSFPAPITSNYAKVENKHRLPAITVAFFMRTSFTDPNSRATPLSYSYKYRGHVVDNALTLLDTNNLVLYIHGYQFHTQYSANSDTAWHHYAVTWEKLNGKWSFYVDGNVVSSGNAGEDKYMHPGTFILGQEQDDIGSRFSTLEAFVGDITEFNVWDYALTVDEIQKISSSCGHIGNVIPWYNVSESVYGDVVVSHDVDKCKTLGRCLESSCDCFYSNEEYSCKFDVKDCVGQNTCSNDQPCISDGHHSFCNCSEGFEGRHCEYDIDECLENNGGCSYFCINNIGTGSHCECPEDMFLAEDGKTCKDTSYCLEDGQTYLNGEVWTNLCQNCTCNQGIIDCEEIVCSKTECYAEETLIKSPGECCPKCIAWSFCLVSPNNSIVSFDMSKYQIEGECKYTVIEDCITGNFKVQIESPQNSTNETNLVIYQNCYKIVAASNGTIFVDNSIIKLPFKNEELVIEENYSSITVKTNSDLLVQWNFMEEIVIGVPIISVNKMCGLCSKIEEYYVYDTGKFPLSQRIASGENECYIMSEGYEDALPPISGSLNIFHFEKVFSVILITLCISFFMCKKLLSIY